ncbi:MAG TPA: RluA family pseudouridine synthase [Oribacterium sp.]|nr:RluA family pseudouridine synthase [Oribacterium sp.]HCS68157.1 RluA family pseudouridine synthase [Oribacterium sp.]
MKIIHQNAHYIVVCKAAGEDAEHDVPERLAEALGGTPRMYYPVHRLDQAASGLLVLARDRDTAAGLSRLLAEGRLHKTYLCVVSGTPETPGGTMKDLLYKDRMKKKMYPVKRKRNGVKEAELSYTVLNTVDRASLVEVTLRTGRFHQIRCQFAARKMPLFGDGKYGSRQHCPHLALFCNTLSFYDEAEKQECHFEVKPPEEYPWTLFQATSENGR